MAVATLGTVLATVFGSSPQATILFAQAANGLLLPLVVVFLFWVMNRRSLLGEYRNGPLANLLGLTVIAVATALGALATYRALGL